MKLKLNLDYKRPKQSPEDKSKWPTSSELSIDYILTAFDKAYPDGLEGQKRRIFGRLQRKLDDAFFNKKTSIETERNELDMILEVFKVAKLPVGISKYVVVLEDELKKLAEAE